MRSEKVTRRYNETAQVERLLVGAVTFAPGMGGLALLARVIKAATEEHAVVSVAETGIEPSLWQKLGFAGYCWWLQVRGRIDATVFDEVGIAQIQNVLPRGLRLPYVVFVAGIEVWKPLSVFERRAVERASMVVAISNYTAVRAREFNPWMPQCEVLPLCLPPDYQPSQTLRRTVRPILLTVSRLSVAYKGHDQILDVWPHVVRRVPGAEYWIAGTGSHLPRLQRKAIDLQVADSVKFLGFVPADKLSSLYEECAVFAMPSTGEGFGLVYLEAMRHKRPCVGSIHDAAREVIDDQRTGRLVDQFDPNMLQEALVQLLSDPALCDRLGEGGFVREREVFSYDLFRERLWTILEDLHRNQ